MIKHSADERRFAFFFYCALSGYHLRNLCVNYRNHPLNKNSLFFPAEGCKLHQPDGSDLHRGHAELQPQGDRVFQRGVPDSLHGLRPCGNATGERREDGRKPPRGRNKGQRNPQCLPGHGGRQVRHAVFLEQQCPGVPAKVYS